MIWTDDIGGNQCLLEMVVSKVYKFNQRVESPLWKCFCIFNWQFQSSGQSDWFNWSRKFEKEKDFELVMRLDVIKRHYSENSREDPWRATIFNNILEIFLYWNERMLHNNWKTILGQLWHVVNCCRSIQILWNETKEIWITE